MRSTFLITLSLYSASSFPWLHACNQVIFCLICQKFSFFSWKKPQQITSLRKKRRLIQFLNLQETVLFLINRNCAFTLLEMELHSYCLKKNENKDVRWIHRASFFKKYLFRMLQCKMQGTFIIIRNLSLKKAQYIFQILWVYDSDDRNFSKESR